MALVKHLTLPSSLPDGVRVPRISGGLELMMSALCSINTQTLASLPVHKISIFRVSFSQEMRKILKNGMLEVIKEAFQVCASPLGGESGE